MAHDTSSAPPLLTALTAASGMYRVELSGADSLRWYFKAS